MPSASLNTFTKRKGHRSECGNYHGVSLLQTAGEILNRAMNNQVKPLAKKILLETQAGFRPSCGPADMIFTMCQLQEKSHEQLQPLYMAFIDLTDALDSVLREFLWDPIYLWMF